MVDTPGNGPVLTARIPLAFTQASVRCHLTATKRSDPQLVTIVLPSRLDGAELETLRPTLLAAVRRPTDAVVVLDGRHVELISSAGLGVLVAAAMIGAETGVRLDIAEPSALFCRSLALTGLGRHLGIAAEPALV
jgi:anti-anti-sigma factor